MSSRNYEEIGYGHHLDLLIILHDLLCVSNPMRIGCRAKSINFKVHLPYVWDRAWLVSLDENAPKHVSIPGAMEVKFYESNDTVGQKHLDMNLVNKQSTQWWASALTCQKKKWVCDAQTSTWVRVGVLVLRNLGRWLQRPIRELQFGKNTWWAIWWCVCSPPPSPCQCRCCSDDLSYRYESIVVKPSLARKTQHHTEGFRV
jgi:hypothetical protein